MRHVVVVCTGNVARSPALAALLGAARPDLRVGSAAVGARAVPGRAMARPMRQLLAGAGLGVAAQEHRSRRLVDVLAVEPVDLVVPCAAVHVRRLAALPGAPPYLAPDPPIPDPAFGGPAAYARVWPLITATAAHLAGLIPPDDGGAAGDALAWFSSGGSATPAPSAPPRTPGRAATR